MPLYTTYQRTTEVAARVAADRNLAANTTWQTLDGWTEYQDIDEKWSNADLIVGAGELWEVRVSGTIVMNPGNTALITLAWRPVDNGVAGADDAMVTAATVDAGRFLNFCAVALLPGAALRVWRLQGVFSATPGVTPVVSKGATLVARRVY
mgnify:CR=1 FL=1